MNAEFELLIRTHHRPVGQEEIAFNSNDPNRGVSCRECSVILDVSMLLEFCRMRNSSDLNLLILMETSRPFRVHLDYRFASNGITGRKPPLPWEIFLQASFMNDALGSQLWW
ncbi:hypothetical protein I7I51_08857 [Histoplasma capsulatum]|uniref:Uncharacterized protein n=1 Tax=Ajellomyces capsulatus TaxID=5037 RepID=A0A8A1M4P9_AJECA|nr:hypothetical protein I7I51_08857 [Histoplasma capsulatum]